MTEFIVIMGKKTVDLSRTELIYSFFCINVCRKKKVDFKYEVALEKHINKMNANEMGIVALGFFKSQSQVKMKYLLSSMMQQIKAEISTIHEIPLTAILKV